MPLPSDRNYDNSLFYVILALLLISCLVIATPFTGRIFRDVSAKLALREFERAFQEAQHPPGTERLATRSAMGEFTESEQGCDFFLGEARRYGGDIETILAFYARQTVKGYPIHAIALESGKASLEIGLFLPDSLNDLAEWGIAVDAGMQQLYMVYTAVIDYNEDPQLDCQ